MNYKDASEASIKEWFAAHKQPAFRMKQVHEWLFNRFATSFDEMQNLPKALRQELSEDFSACSLEAVQCQTAEDRTVKWLFRLEDGNTIETVLIRAPQRNTVCISTQVGCQVHCLFCASGKNGFKRNLTAAEIVDQVIVASREAGQLVTNVVVMGMGEPLHNFNNLSNALTTICSPEGLGLGARHVTVSTSGVIDGIRRLGSCGKPWNLAISLHAVTDEIRSRIIPPRHRSTIAEIIKVAEDYRAMTGRMVTLEYILIDGINATLGDADKLAEIARGLRAKVNLIPSNTDDPHFPPPSADNCQKFLNVLLKRSVQATLRLRKGKDIQAACGQLRQRVEEMGESEDME